MADSADIDAYFKRIDYAGSGAPTLETLSDIHCRHPQAIPFEALDALLKRPMPLDVSSLERKMVHGGRGGWCFEQNLLLYEVLRTLGFRVTGLAARVMWNVPESTVLARSHMLLKIDGLEGGPHIADVGFGGLTLTGPLRLAVDMAQSTPHETFRLVGLGDAGDFVLQALIRDNWKPLYRFDLQPQLLPDYEVSSWYLAHAPESPFVSRLMAARVTPDRRYGLLNNKLSTHPLRGESEQVTLASAGELRQVLAQTFMIQLPEDPGLEPLLARMTR